MIVLVVFMGVVTCVVSGIAVGMNLREPCPPQPYPQPTMNVVKPVECPEALGPICAQRCEDQCRDKFVNYADIVGHATSSTNGGFASCICMTVP